MKKLLFLLLFIPIIILADAAAPSINPYVGEVINKNGAYLYYYDSHSDNYVASPNSVEYGSKVYVYDEYDKFVITENYTDYLLKSDIKKTDITYEEYKKEFDDEDIIPILDEKDTFTSNNTHKTLYICIISAIIVAIIIVVIIVCVNKKGKNKNV